VDEAISHPQIHQGATAGKAALFVMAGLSKPQLRRRAIGSGEPTVDLAQGRNDNYVGDRQVHGEKITLQIHNLNHGSSDHKLDKLDIPYLGIWLPDVSREWAENWIHEA
jgi:hypothetical protein